MLTELVQAIQEGTKAELLTINDQPFVTREVFAPPDDRLVDPLTVHTLDALVEYLDANRDGLEKTSLLIHVQSPSVVVLLGNPMGRQQRRPIFCQVKAITAQPFPFGRFLPIEDFLIQLRSRFVNDENAKVIQRVLGNISDAVVKTAIDDGISQEVTIKAGIARQEQAEVPSPIELKPFRTFSEVRQPSSEFILRLQRVEGKLPQVALFEVEDNLWQLEAVKAIKGLLAAKIADVQVIA